MQHLYQALITVVSKKWDRFIADSRMIKYFRVLRRLSQKVFLLGKHGGTLLFKKSMPFLFVATMSSLLYLLCLKLGSMDLFQSLLSKMGCSLGSRRVLLSRGLGCEGWFLLVWILSAFGIFIFDGTIMKMAVGNETINQAKHRGDAGPSSIQKYPSDSLIAHASREGDSDKELFCTPRQSVSSASSSSTSTPGIDSSPNNGQNEEQYSFTYIQPGSEEHEAMKESFIRIARGKLEEWEASGLIDGLISKKTNEELPFSLELIQTRNGKKK